MDRRRYVHDDGATALGPSGGFFYDRQLMPGLLTTALPVQR